MNSHTERKLSTVRQFSEKNPAFTQAAIRNYVFNAKTNGFDTCIIRIGRKILIDEAAFFQWIERINGKEAAQ
ncbi:hypothetical protein RP726_00845 [Candidatus Methylospira mobilis]|uniref:hypothetical protein n=1 Tax=Candidatus Methylospira mobilis TaxID=1808979 RepID=UPI0028E331D7|nr:hypothetical protein [Candidatus Methylospira mobilis]WNV04976.1 hypothetical protein RP726_00845 [Candidatus Methylospira mobilis]